MSSMRRFFVGPESIVVDRVTVRGPDAHHIATVLRLRPGDRIVAFDGSPLERVVELDRVGNQEVVGRVLSTHPGLRPDSP